MRRKITISQTYASPSILEKSYTVGQLHSISVVQAFLPNSFRILLEHNNSQDMPHSLYVGPDNIRCSCVGFRLSLKRTKPCSHILFSLRYLAEYSFITTEQLKSIMTNLGNLLG